MPTAAAQIADFVTRPQGHALSSAQRHLAYRALLDTLAVSIAGRNETPVRIARQYIETVAGAGSARVWMDDTLMPAEHAAWINGISAHVLDYDDVMAPMRGHPSVVMIPALLALAQDVQARGLDYAAAYAVGFEVLAKLSKVMAFQHYAKGWHSTSSLGIIGAIAGCSALLGLSKEQTVNALGLGVAQAAGTRQNFGTMAKSFQIGECGRAAVRSVLLARAGFDAASAGIDGPFGYLALYGEGQNASSALAELGEGPPELEKTGIEVKKYPCCYATHLALDAALALRQAHALGLNAIARIEISGSAGAFEPLIKLAPTSGLEAKFSLEYTVTTALRDGAVRLSSFYGLDALHPEVMAFLPRITAREEDSPPVPRWAEITIHMRDGTEMTARVDRLRGGAADPLSDLELIEKAQDCFSFASCSLSAHAFADRIFALDRVPLDEVMRGFT